jgi:putative DNA-invertase from lambdoid prophage Rac
MSGKRAFSKAESTRVFGQARKPAKMFRAGLYARVSTQDQQTLPMQNRALREYAARRGWAVAMQVREVGSGAAQREAREKLLEAARRREIDVVLVWRLDRWGRSVTDLLATLQEMEHLGVGFVSLTEALDLTTPAGRAMAGLLAVFAAFEREILGERVRAGLAHARQNGQRLGRPATVARRQRLDPGRPNPQRSYRGCLRTRRAGDGLVLLPGKQNPLPVPGKVHRHKGRLATPEGRERRSARPRA